MTLSFAIHEVHPATDENIFSYCEWRIGVSMSKHFMQLYTWSCAETGSKSAARQQHFAHRNLTAAHLVGNVFISRHQGRRRATAQYFFRAAMDQFGLADRTTQHCSKRCKKGGVPQKRNPSSGTCKIESQGLRRLHQPSGQCSEFHLRIRANATARGVQVVGCNWQPKGSNPGFQGFAAISPKIKKRKTPLCQYIWASQICEMCTKIVHDVQTCSWYSCWYRRACHFAKWTNSNAVAQHVPRNPIPVLNYHFAKSCIIWLHHIYSYQNILEAGGGWRKLAG